MCICFYSVREPIPKDGSGHRQGRFSQPIKKIPCRHDLSVVSCLILDHTKLEISINHHKSNIKNENNQQIKNLFKQQKNPSLFCIQYQYFQILPVNMWIKIPSDLSLAPGGQRLSFSLAYIKCNLERVLGLNTGKLNVLLISFHRLPFRNIFILSFSLKDQKWFPIDP